MLADENQRQAALDITQSCIVQAPAGSGKTSLLTQRFLHLLAKAAQAPEEIIAITFTRKAAAEMRQRIITALQDNQTPVVQKIRQRDQQLQWKLLENPQRLRIMTIDAFCLQLVQRLPLRAKCNPATKLADQPSMLYRQAVTQCLTQIPSPQIHHAIAVVLLHLDNRLENVINLLVSVLANRDQWLPHVFDWHAVAHLESALENVVKELWQQCDAIIPRDAQTSYQQLKARYSEQLPEILLTQKGDWRKRFTDKEAQALAKPFIDCCADLPEIKEYLNDLHYAPAEKYSSAQRELLQALAMLLPILAAELQLVFQEHQRYDFIEITLRALQALGDETQPTDLALHIDYQLRHLLVDEFQDTSVSQLQLLKKLTAGWEADDGRTLFLVGDPMQSIYRFRKAEVGLFLHIQQHGLGDIPLQPLTLTTNFRATHQLVKWFNQSFTQIFPHHANIPLGAIPYTPAVAASTAEMGMQTKYHVVAATAEAEASHVIDILREIWQRQPQAHVAILVRARQHLHAILPALQHAKIAYRAIDIAKLTDYPLLNDLIALTRALLHPADRIAWLAILRAPWCGLSLADLHALANKDQQSTIWQLMQQANAALFSAESFVRLTHVINALQWAITQRGRFSLGNWVMQAWQRLAGPRCLSEAYEPEFAQRYFALLDTLPWDIDSATLEQHVASMFLSQEAPNALLDIMTIHKAKGLEFDEVILAGLNKMTRADQAQLFLWRERVNNQGEAELIVAPVKSAQHQEDKIYAYLQREERKRAQFELQRLLYVAATRAKQVLHLLVPVIDEKPCRHSLLSLLWPVISPDVEKIPATHSSEIIAPVTVPSTLLKRLPLSYFNTVVNEIEEISISAARETFFVDAQNTQRYVGIIVHEQLQHWQAQHFAALSRTDFATQRIYWRQRLIQLGCPLTAIENAIVDIQQCLQKILQDPQAQWLFHVEHQDARNEYALASVNGETIQHIIVDRTFIDKEGKRWIIDYKITPQATREPYQAQLEQYAAILRQQEPRPIWLALYFPLISEWIAWEWIE